MIRSRHRRGVGALEFALTMPVLLTVLLGIVELSLLMHHSHVVTRAARDACRTGAGVLEGPEPTGDLIEAAAEEHAAFALQAAGIDCNVVACEIQATWYKRSGWWLLRVEVGVPYEPITRFIPGMPDVTRNDFVMLTQQQDFAP